MTSLINLNILYLPRTRISSIRTDKHCPNNVAGARRWRCWVATMSREWILTSFFSLRITLRVWWFFLPYFSDNLSHFFLSCEHVMLDTKLSCQILASRLRDDTCSHIIYRRRTNQHMVLFRVNDAMGWREITVVIIFGIIRRVNRALRTLVNSIYLNEMLIRNG